MRNSVQAWILCSSKKLRDVLDDDVFQQDIRFDGRILRGDFQKPGEDSGYLYHGKAGFPVLVLEAHRNIERLVSQPGGKGGWYPQPEG